MDNKLKKKNNMKKKEIEKKKKFLILNLIILLLIFVLFFLLIFVESAYTNIGSVEYYRLVAGNEYRFSKYSGIGGYGGYTRIIYSSGLDLFLPLKTNAEWSAFYNYKPSTITFTYPTCEMVGNTNWGPPAGIYGCTASNQRCYGGVCRTCSGYMYGDGCSGCAGQGGNACWRYSSGTSQSCSTYCGSYGGCVTADWNDGGSCPVCKHFVSLNCGYYVGKSAPGRSPGDWINPDKCTYRSGHSQSCGASSSDMHRLCVCQY